MNKSILIGVVTAVTVASTSLFGGLAHAAGSATFSIAGGGTVVSGNTVSVTINENSADAVNTVTTNLSFDASKLQYAGVTAGSGFGQGFSSTGAGSVSVTRYTDPGAPAVTGTAQVATVSFKVLGASGATTVSTVDSSKIASNGVDVWNHVATGATYNLTAPAQGGMGGGSSTTGTTTTTTSGHSTAVAQNTDNSAAATATTTPAATDKPTSTDVKGDSTKANNDSKKEMVQNTAAKKHNVWPWIILVIVAAAAVAYAMRNRTTKPVAGKEADAKVVKPAETTKKEAGVATATADVNKAVPNKNKHNTAKKSGKKNR
jgi:hypothetical protein